jgi:uncharacterized protein DUF3176
MPETLKRWYTTLSLKLLRVKRALARCTGDDAWLAEWFALLLGFIALTGAVILLLRNNGKSVRSWHSITLNAAVSALAAVTRSMILMAVASCLSQYKWIWFKEQPRPLPDFEVINQASRGPSGALRLLGKNIYETLKYDRKKKK